jgi:hypothetical protein
MPFRLNLSVSLLATWFLLGPWYFPSLLVLAVCTTVKDIAIMLPFFQHIG